jgi:hypothetical protein
MTRAPVHPGLHGIAHARLGNHLFVSRAAAPADAVARLGAVQAQDFAAAKWSLGMRVRGATDGSIEAAFDRGDIVRLHAMRPTWHFVCPADVRSLLALTSPSVHAANASMRRRLELDHRVLTRCCAALEKALGGGCHLTRAELSARLAERGIEARGQRLAYILMHAELEGLICSGPRRGKQFTYALLSERAPGSTALPREEALRGWTLRYFSSHGPAQLKDFSWWSGLPLAEARHGVELAGEGLAGETLDGKTYWSAAGARRPRGKAPAALLLSIFDEYTIAYRDRSALQGTLSLEQLITRGNALTSVLILDGRLAGTWKRTIGRAGVQVSTSPFRPLSAQERASLEEAASAYGRFLGLPVELSVRRASSPTSPPRGP